MKHDKFEKHSLLLIAGILVVISIGGIVEIAPLFWLENTIEEVEGVRPYTPLELAGRNIYIREGCYVCHSQMIRPLRDEVERYGHYSLAAESMYDHPFQWGSKRTGPDLARVGGKYSDEWHRDHMIDPRSVVPESVMPPYALLMRRVLRMSSIAADLKANQAVGVPYTEEMVANVEADLRAQTEPDTDAADGLTSRYPKAVVRDFDGDPTRVTEMDAMIAYLQMLGTTVDFKTYQAEIRPTSGDTMTYEALASFAQTWGLLYFIAIFIGVVIYAYTPRNRAKFDDAARIVLRDEGDES